MTACLKRSKTGRGKKKTTGRENYKKFLGQSVLSKETTLSVAYNLFILLREQGLLNY